MNIKDHINKLKVILNKHNIDYYVKDNPSISDSEYDALLKELENLESKNSQFITSDSPTQRIGGKALNEFKFFTSTIGVGCSTPSSVVIITLMFGSNRMCPRCIIPPVTPKNVQILRTSLPYATASSALHMSGSETISSSGVPARFKSTSEPS